MSKQADCADRNKVPFRVLHVNAGNLYGGVETLLTTLARFRHLCPDMEPHFAVCYEGRLSRELVAAGAPVHFLGCARLSRPWTVWRARRRLWALLQQGPFDVICHMPWSLAIFGSTAQSAGQKLVFWAHNQHYGHEWLERFARRTVPDLVISNSRFVADSLPHLFPGVNPAVLFCPVSLTQQAEDTPGRAALRAELGANNGTTAILQVSRFEAWKGQLLHLEALRQLKEMPDWVCWMVGGPQNPVEERHFNAVRRAAHEFGIPDRVRFLGQRSDVPRLLAAADIFCQPNQGPEPFGIVFVEALWAGRPVVTTAMGGALEIVDESCGVLVEPGNSTKLAEALRCLIESSDLRSRLGQAGPARAQQLCDPGRQITMLRDVVRGVDQLQPARISDDEENSIDYHNRVSG
jgi:glycosyltransferase involved in cell wall biosynthesis